MNSFRDKLERLHESRRRSRDRTEQDDVTGVYRAEEADESEAPPDDRDPQSDEGGDSATEPFQLVRADIDPPARHGSERLGRLADAPLEPLLESFLADDGPTRGTPTPSRILFVDTETTGLADDDYAFCIGWGWLDGAAFRVRHALLRDPDAESELLRASLERLTSCDLLCTYNGANFDLPLLERRARTHDIAAELIDVPHLDLLPVARSVVSELDSHRLQDIERELLDFTRTDDLPGAEVPAKWEAYLRERNLDVLQPVLHHNRLDIASLCAALDALARRVSDSPTDDSRPDARRERGEVGERLARSYRMRGPDGTDSDAGGVSRETSNAPASGATDGDRSDDGAGGDRSSDAPNERVRDLRREVERALAADDPSEARELLFEMIAIHPRHPFALNKLVDLLESDGQTALADHFRARLREVAPF